MTMYNTYSLDQLKEEADLTEIYIRCEKERDMKIRNAIKTFERDTEEHILSVA